MVGVTARGKSRAASTRILQNECIVVVRSKVRFDDKSGLKINDVKQYGNRAAFSAVSALSRKYFRIVKQKKTYFQLNCHDCSKFPRHCRSSARRFLLESYLCESVKLLIIDYHIVKNKQQN